jgi:hypothetical protein
MADGVGRQKESMGHACAGMAGIAATPLLALSPTGAPEIAFLIYGSA